MAPDVAVTALISIAVLFGLLYRSAGQRQWALVVVRDVPAGQVVSAADLAARTIRPPAELPLGAVTAILGVPFFLAQLRKTA